tara:strand:- start:900 stop:1058 length:159 start_codon:yes stop_codon:yes gene_type:complete
MLTVALVMKDYREIKKCREKKVESERLESMEEGIMKPLLNMDCEKGVRLKYA